MTEGFVEADGITLNPFLPGDQGPNRLWEPNGSSKKAGNFHLCNSMSHRGVTQLVMGHCSSLASTIWLQPPALQLPHPASHPAGQWHYDNGLAVHSSMLLSVPLSHSTSVLHSPAFPACSAFFALTLSTRPASPLLPSQSPHKNHFPTHCLYCLSSCSLFRPWVLLKKVTEVELTPNFS